MRDSWYYDFNGWVDNSDADICADCFRYTDVYSTEDLHEFWLMGWGLLETCWMIYCEQYDGDTEPQPIETWADDHPAKGR